MSSSIGQLAAGVFPESVRRWLGWLVTASILAAIGVVIVRNAGELSQWDWSFDPLRFSAAFVLAVATYPLFALGWRQCLLASGGEAQPGAAVRIFARSQLARYLPGSLWNFVGRALLCAREGIDRPAAVGSMVLENAATIACALLVFAATLPLWPSKLETAAKPALGVVAVLVLLILHPKVFARIVRLAARVSLSHEPDIDLSFGQLVTIAAHYVAAWIVTGLAFWMFASSAHSLPIDGLPVLAGGFAVAWVTGFVAVFVPCGLGVREAVAVAVLSMFVPPAAAGMIAVAFRLLQILAELVWAAVASTLGKEKEEEGTV